MLQKKPKSLFISTILSIMLIFSSSVITNANAVFEKQSNTSKFLCNYNNSSYYINENQLIKVTIEELHSEITRKTPDVTRTSLNYSPKTIVTQEKEIIVKTGMIELSNEDKQLLANASTRTAYLTRTGEAVNSMNNIKAKLSVDYWDNSDQVFSDGYDLSFISATGTWSRIGAIEGVSPQTSEVRYSISGSIHDANGNFVGRTLSPQPKKFNSPTFSNVKLMNGYYAEDCVSAGVTYTLHCTRDVNINVYMQFV